LARSEKEVIFTNEKRKVTWKDIFENFKSVYPRLSKEAQDYRPYNYMSIVIYLEDGSRVVYDDLMKRARMLAV
jgi:hypothetical protein